MHHFFVDKSRIDDEYVTITGGDVNHIKNVLRMKAGDELLISDGISKDYLCRIEELAGDTIKARIYGEGFAGSEPDCEFYLFQCLPKGDKLETIVQKAVELGVKAVIPVASKRAVVKLDEKKAEAKLRRWNAIAESAAKQSRRAIVPQVHRVMTFKEAAEYSKGLDISLIPYENYKDMASTRGVLDRIRPGMKAGIFIGPEGGFDEEEIALAIECGMERVSLGKRILRTETAGMALLAVLMFKMEK